MCMDDILEQLPINDEEKIRNNIPNDLLNLIGSFVGDDYVKENRIKIDKCFYCGCKLKGKVFIINFFDKSYDTGFSREQNSDDEVEIICCRKDCQPDCYGEPITYKLKYDKDYDLTLKYRYKDIESKFMGVVYKYIKIVNPWVYDSDIFKIVDESIGLEIVSELGYLVETYI